MAGQGLQKNTPSYLKAQANGFGAPGQGRPRTKTEDLTDLIDDMVLEHGDELTAMALQAIKDGMRGRDLKTRLDAAKAYLHNFHNPAKRLDVDVNEQVTISQAAREATDGLTDEEQAIMARFEERLLSMRPEEHDIDPADVVEEHDDDEPAAPATGGSGWDAPNLPPLPTEGREA